MMLRASVLFLCLAPSALAQSGISVPRAGCVVDSQGVLRPLYGVAGSYAPGPAVRSGVVSAACSERLALVKTARTLEIRNGALQLLARWPAPEGPARFAFVPDAPVAFAYFSSTREWIRIDARRAPCAASDSRSLAGDALAIASPDFLHLLAVLRGASGFRLVRLSTRTGAIEQELPLPRLAGPVLLRPDGTLLYGRDTELVLRRPSGEERSCALPAPAASIYASSDRLAVIGLAAGGAPAALTLDEGREQLLRIPEMPR